jgi:hypothetical protein
MVLLLWLGNNGYMQQTIRDKSYVRKWADVALNKPSKQALQSNVVR